MKKRLSVFLVVVTLMLNVLPAYAEENMGADDYTAEYIAEQLGGEAISPEEVPDDVVPIEFDTIEEAKEFIAEQDNMFQDTTFVANESSDDTSSSVSDGGWSRKLANTATKTASCTVTPLSSMKIMATYTYANNKFVSVTEVKTSFTGYTVGSDWNQDTYSSSITNDGKKLNVTVYGHMDLYLLINSKITKLGAENKQFSASWDY